MIYYLSGVPCSDELYHHGVEGQKWGVRRYQNKDGSYTALGRIHYGVKKTGEAIGKGAKTVGKGVATGVGSLKTSFKNSHPQYLSDEELQARINRINMENRYRELLRENQRPINRGSQVVQDIIESAGRKVTSGLIDMGLNVTKEKMLAQIRSNGDEERERRQEARDIARERRQEARDIAREQRQDARDIARDNRAAEERRRNRSLSERYDDYVTSTMPSNIQSWSDSDWDRLDRLADRRRRLRAYETAGGTQNNGGNNGKKKKNKNKNKP